ncbi:hypothetical protein B0S90_2758 [Caldicellulosiruptor bescii]|uniref:Uncharacterized protein n=2 Tax=Caldicellulosiruptor bescii TaxID=31899 RepID=B9MNF2_CALBD|nr:hypothetical protein [Caldicellulosiruptor bescii]ACM61483.1 hypothetical protein Athe_2415 [Caldicellulosiruptor bescii DSM 6725]PBC88704.1 hypothetical protein B0S87_1733 [Caldicellulosiruptor bescii]PBC91815.1 hypothetical protein B0S89_2260 [Caldicellulosiruptor bescii]PBD02774.1 hypothetical protein B0S85_0314 [Caldicellulosiruptor bescii]PBD07610.1 hypothetical protein B0S90_2758 [Caldicellulosiruptor bescii]
MHYVHFILVNVPELKEELELNDFDNIKEEIRNYAEEQTSVYSDIVYDWRETETAGRWADEFPENVVLGSEQPEKVREILDRIRRNQQEEIENYVSTLKEHGWIDSSGNFTVSVSKLIEEAQKGLSSNNHLFLYCLSKLMAYLSGEYLSNSFFFSTYHGTAYLDDTVYEEVYKKPEQFAFVIFDYHN